MMVLGFFFSVVLAATTVTPAPLTHSFTATMAHKVDDLGMQIVREKRSPGLALAIVEDGRIVYSRGFGYADLTSGRRIEPETQFYVGSINKQFTAAAILLLAQEGKLKLDDRVTKYVPELTIAGTATITQLLNQDAGLPDYTTAPGLKIDYLHTVKMSDVIAAVNKAKSPSAPGSTYAYNNFNYNIAALIVERVSGVPLSDYLDQHIFMPLVMNQSFLAGDTGISSAHAAGYTGHPGKLAKTPMVDPAWLLGAGGLVTNVYDLAKWDIGLPLLLRDDAIRSMFTPSDAAGPTKYGMGWVIDERGGKRYIWHNGEVNGFLAMNALLPDDHIAVIVLENVDRFASPRVAMPEEVASQVLDIVLPPSAVRVDNIIMAKAREWLARIADKRIDRTQLTANFSAYLTDDLVAKANFAALGKPQTLIPVASISQPDGSTTYEFLVHYPHQQFRYKLTLTKDLKVDGLLLSQ
jgi:D-alanyl-D-alanine carboxypeptidase